MAVQAQAVLGRIIRSAAQAAHATLTDRDLLRRYADDGDETAFAALVARHTGMVLGVCRRVVPTVQDAEDACQATFLVLAKKAKSTRWQPSVANWLYTTARRVSSVARLGAIRRAKREAVAAAARAVEPMDAMTGRELLAALDEELDRLPTTYREPLVLCYLEGLSRDEAASRLRIPAGTVKIRLERGRKKLGDALTKRGVVVGASLLALAATSPAGASAPQLVESVLAAAGGTVSPAVAALAEGVAVNKSLWVAAALAVVATLGVGVGVGVVRSPAGQPPEKATPAKPAPAADAKAGPAKPQAEVTGRVFAPDGKPLAGAKLLLLSWGDAAVELGTSDADGRFAVRMPADTGSSALAAVAEGVGIDFIALHTVTAGSPVELRTVADRPIRGRVVTTQGKPVAGAAVDVRQVGVYAADTLDGFLEMWPNRGDRRLLRVEPKRLWEGQAGFTSATTDADGRFTITGVGIDRAVALRVRRIGFATHTAFLLTRDDYDRQAFNDAVAERNRTRRGNIVYWPLSHPDPLVIVEPDKPVRGVVRDAATGQPRPGTRVELYSLDRNPAESMPTATTDAAGRYEVRGFPKAKQYSVVAWGDAADGYLSNTAGADDTPGHEPVVIDVPVAKGVVVTGRVTDAATGKPLRVFARSERLAGNQYVEDKRYLALDREPSILTPDGRYRAVVPPGPVLLTITARSPFPDGMPATVRFAPAEWDPDQPGYFTRHEEHDAYRAWNGHEARLSGNWCKVVNAAAGTVVTHDAALKRAPPPLPLTIRDADGKPVAGAWVHGAVGSPIPTRHATAAAEVDRPRFGMRQTVAGWEPTRNLVGLLTVKDDETGPPTLALRPGGVVTGRVVAADGTPVKGVRVRTVYARDATPAVGRMEDFAISGAAVETDAAGAFRIASVFPGERFHLRPFGKDGNPLLTTTIMKEYTIDNIAEPLDLGDVRLKPAR
ncbi:MAG: sigma-70 family RNA polymerase sigma factor [Gemmataceae bacterium]